MAVLIGTRRLLRSLLAAGLLLGALAVPLPGVVAQEAPAAAVESVPWAWVETPHFRIAHHPEHQPQAVWYGDFVEQVYADVADLFGEQLEQPVTLYLYPTDSTYVEANPLAAASRQVLAHARNDGYEVGLALTRLERLPPELRVDTFRHELAHLLMTQRSGDRLTVGWHEGLAQYVEQDRSLRPQAITILKRAQAEDLLLPLSAFEAVEQFYGRAPIAYPQSYAVVAYLADRYGFGRFLDALQAIGDGADTEQAFTTAFSRPLADLEAEWRAALPEMLAGAWPTEALAARHLAPAQRALAEGRLTAAVEYATAADRVWQDLGRVERAAEAAAIRAEAEGRLEFERLLAEGHRAFAAHQYAEAVGHFGAAAGVAQELPVEEAATQASAWRDAAARGEQAIADLAAAQTAFQSCRTLPPALGCAVEARAAALVARDVFAELGDAARAAEADALQHAAMALQQRMGLALLGVAMLALAGLGVGWRRRASRERAAGVSAPGVERREEGLAL